MALRRTFSKRLFSATTLQPPAKTLINSPSPSQSTSTSGHRRAVTSPSSFRHFLQLRTLNNDALPSHFLSLPVGDKLREKLQSLNITGHQLPQLPPSPPADDAGLRLTAADAKRVMRFVQLEVVREKLRNIPASTVPYTEFVRICVESCGGEEMGLELAKALDESGNVIVLGAVVFLHPDEVAKSMETLIWKSIGMPDDPRRAELEKLESEKLLIDEKARTLVRRELWCGLGLLTAQTLGFMRLTFWELTWDVMEPICFFVASFHFALAYAFFLRTSKEPSFEAFFQRRFQAKQSKLFKTHNFDIHRYNQLCHTFYRRDHGRGPVFRLSCTF